jgi:hypothetical protein
MPEISAKTVRLSRGRHVSPEVGACVVELASMLAGEAFTDRPHSVSPVVAAFLRGYNDGVGDRRRQDLYPLAAEVVGSTASVEIERARLDRCREWTRTLYRTRWGWRWATCFGGFAWVEQCGHRAGARAARDASGTVHAAALSLVRELSGSEPLHAPAPAREPAAPIGVSTG